VAGPFGSSISSKYFVESGIPVIRGSNLSSDLERFISKGFVFVSEERAKKYKAQTVAPDDLVFTCWGTIGQTGIIPRQGPYEKYIISNKQLKLRVNTDIADPLYIYFYFAGRDGVEHVKSYAKGAAVPGISLGILKGLKIALPPLHVQRRIASILSAYDDLIENNTRRIAILEEMARRLYEEWFVHFRFPGHEVAGRDDKLPNGWERVPLKEIASVNPESIKPRSAPSSINYIDIASVSPGRIDQIQAMNFVDAPSRARRKITSGDILWSCVRPNRRSHALVLSPEPDTVASTGFAVLRAEKVPHSYLYQAVTTDAFVAYLVNHATGAAYPAVKQTDFEVAQITVPSSGLLKKFAGIAEPMVALAHVLFQRNTNLRTQRDLLLPKLVSGEIDVSEAETAAAEAAE